MVDIVGLLQRLNDQEVRYVVVGGVAANAHGTMRISEDLDLFAPLDHANAVKIIRAMHGLHPRWWMRPDLPEVTPDSHNLKGIRNIYLRTDLGRLDVLGEMEGAEDYESIERRSVERDFGGVRCRVVDIDSLIAVKKHVGREKDKSDARELELLRLAAKDMPPTPDRNATS